MHSTDGRRDGFILFAGAITPIALSKPVTPLSGPGRDLKLESRMSGDGFVFEVDALGHNASLDITPKSDGQLASHGDKHDPAYPR